MMSNVETGVVDNVSHSTLGNPLEMVSKFPNVLKN